MLGGKSSGPWNFLWESVERVRLGGLNGAAGCFEEESQQMTCLSHDGGYSVASPQPPS